MHAYPVEQLKRNRAAVLVHGGTEADRRAFAVEAAQGLGGEPLVDATDASSLERSLKNPRGVVYVPDCAQLPWASQREVVRVIKEQEERPKLVLGLSMAPQAAVDKGLLREDLQYWMRRAEVALKQRFTRK